MLAQDTELQMSFYQARLEYVRAKLQTTKEKKDAEMLKRAIWNTAAMLQRLSVAEKARSVSKESGSCDSVEGNGSGLRPD